MSCHGCELDGDCLAQRNNTMCIKGHMPEPSKIMEFPDEL